MAYVTPARTNPLRRLPVRSYRSPIASRLPGLGQVGTPGGCPGAPGCPGYQVTLEDLQNLPMVSGPAQSPTSQVLLALSAAQMNPNIGPAGATFTDWMNSNAKAAVWIAGIAVGALLIAKL